MRTDMSIVTKTGDKGDTGLFGPERVSKGSPRLHAVGTVDELNALIGLITTETDLPKSLSEQLKRTQHLLFVVGADLATPLERTTGARRITQAHVATLEWWIEEYEGDLPPLQTFILPDGCRVGALLHLSRTVCRRAERWVVALKQETEINPSVLIFLNRLGDLLFLMARAANCAGGTKETPVHYE